MWLGVDRLGNVEDYYSGSTSHQKHTEQEQQYKPAKVQLINIL